ncbi:aminotransferase class I/II-fold pyridoxal phosphate-dependent enzyme [Lacticaseibacillus chiayiensis]|uniref:aminotransferase class I/II-fold pyridoxal phosphate-dependent enzyme n=1 Tax=Lacticaseibacillus chiayiensis TaxID=2100821 RepID=UPI001BCAB23F|nr:aminotransferase class I/II-fold pyridoxal phosphate-dependent enzyme [Lacticaseibacillus chiayiensis]QVI35595.1 aminotransferase class I/II-fold pyridoxal phosphate-dependent enzyme [Lacticaseibacillus chiayiensis]
MQAVILAAGKGSRFKQATKHKPKCMLSFNGETLIGRMIRQLNQLDLKHIVIVAGYKEEVLTKYLKSIESRVPITILINDQFATSNNIVSVAKASSVLEEDETLLVESDVIIRDELMDVIRDAPTDAAIVSSLDNWMDGTVVTFDDDHQITAFVSRDEQQEALASDYFKTVNIYKLSCHFNRHYFLPYVRQQIRSFGGNDYYETVFGALVALKKGLLRAVVVDAKDWDEVDTLQELRLAEIRLNSNPTEKMKRLSRQYGGYWRFPDIKDYAYLVNPFFPPEKLVQQFQTELPSLLTAYPSGMTVNSELAAEVFDLMPKRIVVGNGASELIQAALKLIPGKIGVIRPTFEEYPNRVAGTQIETMTTQQMGFRYTERDVIHYFSKHPVNCLVLINPDNPSGNYLQKREVLTICKWAQKLNIRVIVDESFIDFVDAERHPSLLNEDLLKEFPNLIVIKSISKSYGVPGVRLGVLASGHEALVAQIKRVLPIWNINAFGQFFLQKVSSYQLAYNEGLVVFYKVRKRFFRALETIPYMTVLPSQANFFMVQLVGVTSQDLSSYLLESANILIKDLGTKPGIEGEYVRLAVKTDAENQTLIQALRAYDGNTTF